MIFNHKGEYCVQGNCLELLGEISKESIDCVITDPPYPTISGGTPDNPYVNRPSGILSKNDGKIFDYNNIDIKDWIGEIYRVMKQNTHLYIMTNFLNLLYYMQEIEKAGFQLHNLLIWEKNNATPNRWYMKNCEYIIFARKGAAKPIKNCGTKTVLTIKNVSDKMHPTEKPIELLEILIKNSSEKGQIILDPFAGSFSTIVAAIRCGRRGVGFEIDEKYFEKGRERLKKTVSSEAEEVAQEIRRTPSQEKILVFLRENEKEYFNAEQIASSINLPMKTISGCFTPLFSQGLIEKTKEDAVTCVRIKRKE